MKSVFIFLILGLTSSSLNAQENVIINFDYPYEVVKQQKNYDLIPGNYVFKTDFEYISFLNSDIMNPILVPVFFSEKEMGLIIRKELSSGSYGFLVESVYETNDKIIVNTKIIKPNYFSCDLSARVLFIKLKKSNKEVVVTETF